MCGEAAVSARRGLKNPGNSGRAQHPVAALGAEKEPKIFQPWGSA